MALSCYIIEVPFMSINELERRHPRPPAAPVQKPRRYLRKQDVRVRYGWKTALSVDRAWRIYGTLPPPTTWQSRSPLWDEAILDAHDAANRLRGLRQPEEGRDTA
jgi:hypothetical protein